MADIKNREDLERWLSHKPIGASRVIALRMALRVLPLVSENIRHVRQSSDETETGMEFIQAQMRALSSAFAISLVPLQAEELRNYAAASLAATFTADTPAVRAAVTAVRAATAACIGNAGATRAAARTTVRSAAHAGGGRSAGNARVHIESALWRVVEADCNALDDNANPTALATAKLWPKAVPNWFRIADASLAEQLAVLGEDRQVWTEWFRRRVEGGPADEILEIRRVKIEEADWQKGAAHVNGMILRMEEARALELEPQLEPEKANWDFFISYTGKNEDYAKWFDALLLNARYRNFAQFKNIAVGKNFVVEMNKGLAGSSRLLALLSPAYKESKHGQAEWAAAYNQDPDGSRGKVIGVLAACRT